MKKSSRLILIVFFILIQSIFSFASSNVTIRKSNNVPSDPIELKTDKNSVLESIKYTTSATGASSGIRYRFTELKVQVGDFTYILDTKNLIGAKPPAGVTEYYDITITKENILASIEKQLGRKLNENELRNINKDFQNPSKINLGATVEIYNANTGTILERIHNSSGIKDAFRRHGFSNKHIEDALSRFREKKLPVPESREEIPDSGLSPAFLVPN